MFICKCCSREAKWCSEGGNGLDPHDCDHIHCHHCGMHYSLESEEAMNVESMEELRDLMEKAYNRA